MECTLSGELTRIFDFAGVLAKPLASESNRHADCVGCLGRSVKLGDFWPKYGMSGVVTTSRIAGRPFPKRYRSEFSMGPIPGRKKGQRKTHFGQNRFFHQNGP